MLPPVLLMHRVDSSHSESHSGGLVKLPSNYLFKGFFSRHHCFISTFYFPWGLPLQGPPYMGLPPRAPRVLGGPRCQGAPG